VYAAINKQQKTKNSKENSMKLNLDIERLEARIAPGGLPSGGGEPGEKVKGNNGFGNGGDDPAPGNSGTNAAPSAAQKLEDIVR